MADDPYVYPGTEVLRNLAGIQDAAELQKLEALATFKRLTELEYRPLRGSFDVSHLQRIHRHVFQDVYSWAGEFRSVNIAKAGQWFCRPEFIVQTLSDLFSKLKKEDQLRRLKLSTFLTRAGYFLGELNAIHPFREGNGRVQREFIREIGLYAGFRIDWTTVTQDAMYSASEKSFRSGDHYPLVQILTDITTPLNPS